MPAQASNSEVLPEPSSASLRLFVNGEPVQAAPGSLAQWLAAAGLQADKVATAINGDFVPRDRRDSLILREGDRLDVFRAIVGG